MIVIYALFALETINFSLFMTVYSKQLILLGGTDLFGGLLGSTTAFLGLLWKPIAGNLSEEKGYKKLLIWCITPCIIGNFVSCFATSLPVFFIFRALCGMGSPVQTLLRTATADLAKSNQSDVFNKIAAVGSIMFVLGLLLSNHIVTYENGLVITYTLINISSIINIVLIYLFLPDSSSSSKQKPETRQKLTEVLKGEVTKAFTNLRNICLSNKYLNILIVKTTLDLSFLFVVMNLGYRLRVDYKMEDQHVGYLMLAFSLLSMIVNIALVQIDKIWKNKTKVGLKYGSLIQIVSFVGMALSRDVKIFSAFFLLTATVKPSLDSDVTKWQLSIIGKDEKAVVFSSFDTVYSLTELISPLFASIISEYLGASTNYAFCAILVGIGTLALMNDKHKVHVQ